MPSIQIELLVQAPRELCFDLARDIDLHVRSTSHTKEKPVAGVTSGLIGMGEEVTWEATHFFVRQQLTSRITAFRRPEYFRDTQIRGAFRRFDHDHFFHSAGVTGTRMVDHFDYTAPFGWMGQFADLLFLQRYMRHFLQERSKFIKRAAEEITRTSGSLNTPGRELPRN